jgi:L-rhamnose-H+ transport protein
VTLSAWLGVLIVVMAGMAIGVSPWPIKRMRRFQYEHWAFVAMLVGMVLTPWMVTLLTCPDAMGAYRSVGIGILLKSNLFSLSWGIANVLYMLCLVQIGVSMTNGIVTGVGASLGVVTPMVFKGTGAFQDASAVFSPAGCVVLAGVAVMLSGVVLVCLAGLGRDRAQAQHLLSSRGFRRGLAMAILAGALSAGISFAFVYSQGPILEAMKSRGAADIPANVAVWAAGLLTGVLLNVFYPAYLMTIHKSWNVLLESRREAALAVLFGLTFFTGFALMGKGMLLLGPLGASIGFGVQQTMQMLGGQAVGFFAGEWQGIGRKPRVQMYCAIVILVLAAAIMSFGNALAK